MKTTMTAMETAIETANEAQAAVNDAVAAAVAAPSASAEDYVDALEQAACDAWKAVADLRAA